MLDSVKEQMSHWRGYINKYLGKAITDLKLNSRMDILDVGWGASQIIKKRLPNILVCDVYERGTVDIVCDICEDIPKDKFDAVFCMEVLEHTKAPWKAAANLKEILKPNGHLIVSVPSYFHWHSMKPVCGDYWRFFPGHIPYLFPEAEIVDESICMVSKNFPLGMCYILKWQNKQQAQW